LQNKLINENKPIIVLDKDGAKYMLHHTPKEGFLKKLPNGYEFHMVYKAIKMKEEDPF